MKPSAVTVVLLALALLAAACGGGGGTAAGDTGEAGEAGSVTVSGSSTVEPISALVAERFSEENPDVQIFVEGPGTGDGFALFCNGETDISDASRPIREEEAQACAEAGVEYVELKVAIDGLSVLTSPEGEGIADCLNFGDMYALVGPESTGFEQWSDANDLAAQVDALAAPYPDLPLVITAPGEESGTYDSFVEIVLEETAEQRDQEAATRPDYTASGNDNVIIEGISGTPSSFGWVGYAFFVENQDVAKAFEIDGGEGCVAPTPETIADGTYPISRPLFIYVNTSEAQENPALHAYVDFYLSEAGLESVAEAGYIQLTEEEWQSTVDAWENA